MQMLVEPGLYRTTVAYPGHEDLIPADALVFVGRPRDSELGFVVHPQQNRHNRWYWNEPTVPMTDPSWEQTLRKLPTEGFYTLPEELHLDGGGIWRKNAIVQLGYDRTGRGILFVGERHDGADDNALYFADRGTRIDDTLLDRLVWAPILPVRRMDA